MSSTRAQIRDLMGSTYGLARQLVTTSAGNAGGTTFVVSGEADADASAKTHDGIWAYDVTQAQERRIRVGGFSGTLGTFTVSPAFSAQVAITTTVELWTVARPSEVNAAINRALQRYVGRRVKDTSITLDSVQARYILPTWVRAEDDILEVYVVPYTGSSVSKGYEIEVPWWKVRADELSGVRRHYLHVYPQYSSDYTLVVLAEKFYDALSTEVATTEAPIEWVAARATVELLRGRVRRAEQMKDSGLVAVYQAAREDDMRWRMNYLPAMPQRIMPESPFNLYENSPYPG